MSAKRSEGSGKPERRDATVRDRRDNPLQTLQREMNVLFENFTSGKAPLSFGRFDESLRGFTPRMDIVENATEVRVSAELPGMSAADIAISVENDVLSIEGNKKPETKRDEKGYYRMERSYGVFLRTVRIPTSADVDKGTATFKDGILTLVFPKRPQSRPAVRAIPVQPG